MTINYTVTGISRNFTPPALADTSSASTYNVVIQPIGTISQFTIQVDHAGLSKYAVDATGTITINDPA